MTTWTCDKCGMSLRNVMLPVRHNCRPIAKPSTKRIMGTERLITTTQLVEDTLRMVVQMPKLRAVVGIARSGILPASTLATHLGTALYSLDNRTGEVMELGRGRRFEKQQPEGRVLLIDDSIYSGFAMSEAAPRVTQHFGEAPLTAAVYARGMTARKVDFYARISERHWFQWNIFNHPLLEHWAFDLDGVFCRDFAPHEDDDGDLYCEIMRSLPGTHNRPRKPISIVTARLEKYRDITEEWLDRQGIPVEALVMGPWRTKQEREKADLWGWKAEQIKRLGKRAYVESSQYGAKRLHDLTGLPVICTDTNEAFYV